MKEIISIVGEDPEGGYTAGLMFDNFEMRRKLNASG